MGNSLPAYDREQQILEILVSAGRVSVLDLSERLGVSAVTVRHDLNVLAGRGRLQRVRGGARLTGNAPRRSRLDLSARERTILARNARNIVKPGMVVALDESTVAYCVARELSSVEDLVLVPVGIPALRFLAERSSARIVVPGGSLRRESESLVIADASMWAYGEVDLGFFGLSYAGLNGGREVDQGLALTKATLSAKCVTSICFTSGNVRGGFGVYDSVPASTSVQFWHSASLNSELAASWGRLGAKVIELDLTGPGTNGSPELPGV